MVDADTDELEAPATADDVYVTLRQLEHFARHDPGAQQRVRRVALLLTPIAKRLLRRKIVFAREQDGRWYIGAPGEGRLYSDDRRGLVIAHFVMSRDGEFVTYEELSQAAPGAATLKSVDNALRNARDCDWVRRDCPALADAIATITCTQDGVRYDWRDNLIEVVTEL